VPIALRVAFGETRPVPPPAGFFVDDLGDQMFGFTKREVLIFVTGLLLVTSLCVSGTIYVLQYYLVLHDPADPLGQRFHSLNHIRLPPRACMTKCE
jgi:hypothetical protein